MIEIKCTIIVMHLNHLETIPYTCLWKSYLPGHQSLVPKGLGTIAQLEQHLFLNFWLCWVFIAEWAFL